MKEMIHKWFLEFPSEMVHCRSDKEWNGVINIYEKCMCLVLCSSLPKFYRIRQVKDKFEGCMTIRHRVAAFQSFTK